MHRYCASSGARPRGVRKEWWMPVRLVHSMCRLLGGGGPRSAVENTDCDEAMKCTKNAGSVRERPGVTWREWSPRRMRSTMESVEHAWISWSTARCLGVGGVTGITWIAVENVDSHGRPVKARSVAGCSGAPQSPRSGGDHAKHANHRGVPQRTGSVWTACSATEHAERRGAPRSAAEHAERRGAPRSAA